MLPVTLSGTGLYAQMNAYSLLSKARPTYLSSKCRNIPESLSSKFGVQCWRYRSRFCLDLDSKFLVFLSRDVAWRAIDLGMLELPELTCFGTLVCFVIVEIIFGQEALELQCCVPEATSQTFRDKSDQPRILSYSQDRPPYTGH